MVAFFNKKDGKLDFLVESLTFEKRTLANISVFSLTVFVGISVSWITLEVYHFQMSLSLFVFLKKKKEVFDFYCGLLL